MARDEDLRQLLTETANSSEGVLQFRATNISSVSASLGIPLGRSQNPVYEIQLRDDAGEVHTLLAFTLILSGIGRPATRAEGLAGAIAASDGRVFDYNPFLLAYDYAGGQLLAVSAMTLFKAYAEHASENPMPVSGSANFSLTPSFHRRTINMYTEVREPALWSTSTAPDEFSGVELVDFLQRVVSETSAGHPDRSELVEAVRRRLTAVPDGSTAGGAAVPGATPAPDYVQVSEADSAVQVDNRIWQMILAAISSSPAVLLVGPPGTGKSALVRRAVGELSRARIGASEAGLRPPLWATPDESWTARELIGGETIAGGEIVFRPGWVLRSIAEGRWLVLDEANRGDLDRIFGALLTWLSGGDVSVGMESASEDARPIILGWTDGPSRVDDVPAGASQDASIRYLASRADWRLLGTYNALDAQRVFRIGAALGRRFARVPIPPVSPGRFIQILAAAAADLDHDYVRRINALYAAHFDSETTQVGPALFLGMCGYVRAATELRSPAHAAESDQGKVAGGVEPGAELISPELVAGEESTLSRPIAADGIVAEAYVLAFGTLLAQLEEPDVLALADRIEERSALSREGFSWARQMARALA